MSASTNRIALHQRWLRSGVTLNVAVAPSLCARPDGAMKVHPNNVERFDGLFRRFTRLEGRHVYVGADGQPMQSPWLKAAQRGTAA